MKIEEMKVCDVLKLGLFRSNVAKIIQKAESEIKDAQFRYGAIKRTPYDRLKEKGVLRADKIPYLYEMVIDKRLNGYSSSERRVIEYIGNTAFNMTMNELYKQKKEERNDKETD